MDHLCFSVLCLLCLCACLEVTFWERADLLALVSFVVSNCEFCHFPIGNLGQVWYLIYGFQIFAAFLTFINSLPHGDAF